MSEPHETHPGSNRAQHIEWVESLLEAPLFRDEGQAALYRSDPYELSEDETAMRNAIGMAVLRPIAEQRHADRKRQAANRPQDPRDFNAAWQLTPGQATAIKEEHSHMLRLFRRRSIIINNLAEGNPPDRPDEKLRPDQESFPQAAAEFAQAAPNMSDIVKAPPSPERTIFQTMGFVAPTGAGKSAIEGDIVHRARIGKPASETDQERLRALVVTPSLALVKQFSGTRGKNLLKRLAGDVRVSAYFGRSHDDTGDVVATTTDMIRRGNINPHDFDLTITDEGHHLLGKQLTNKLYNLGLGGLVMAFTATDKYDDGRQLPNALPYMHYGRTHLEYMEDGKLNGAQLFTFRPTIRDLGGDSALYELTQRQLNESISNKLVALTASLVAKLAAEGRRTAIYCQAGQGSLQAREVADQINQSRVEIIRPDGSKDFVRAEAVGKFNSSTKNDEILKALDDHTVDAITTVSMLREGWDADIDAVIIIGGSQSQLKLRQIVGRGARPSKEFPVTVYIELIPPFSHSQYARRTYSLWELFGTDEIEQGRVFRPASLYQSQGSKHALFEPPDALRQYLDKIDHQLVRSVLIATSELEDQQEVPPDYVELDELMAIDPNYLSSYHLMKTLEKAGFAYVGRRELRPEFKRRRIIAYFPPEAATYLRENPMPPQAEAEEPNLRTLAECFGMYPKTLQAIIDTIPEQAIVASVERVNKVGQIVRRFTAPAVERIKQAVKDLPAPEDDEVRLIEVVEQLGCGTSYVDRWCEQHNLSTPTKRHPHPISGRYVYSRHMRREDADALWAQYYATPEAEPGDMTLSDMTRAAGYALRKVLLDQMTDQERASAQPRWPIGKRRPVREHFPAEIVQTVLERVRPEPLPMHLVTLPALEKMSGQPRHIVRYFLKTAGFEPETLRLNTRPTTCYPWAALEALDERFGLAEAVPHEKLPRYASDSNLEHIAAAHRLQRLYDPKVVTETKEILAHAAETQRAVPPASSARPYTYTKPAKAHMDAKAIAAQAGLPAEFVEETIKKLRIVGGTPVHKGINEHGELTDHYSEFKLDMVFIATVGLTPQVMADRLDAPIRLVEDFLYDNNLQPTHPNMAHGPQNWHRVQKAFRHPPSGYTSLSSVAEEIGWTVNRAAEFAQQNGGKLEMFFDGKNRTRYADPYTHKLLTAQTANYPEATQRVNREEIARLTNQPPEAFDAWINHNPQVKQTMAWHTVRGGGKVLPHYTLTAVMPYVKKQRVEQT